MYIAARYLSITPEYDQSEKHIHNLRMIRHFLVERTELFQYVHRLCQVRWPQALIILLSAVQCCLRTWVSIPEGNAKFSLSDLHMSEVTYQ